MGASNVAAAYAKYADKVPPLSMVLLIYMANVSKDSDPEPWYGEGHAALACGALGRDMPISDTDLKAVRRAIKPLLQVGAITVSRKPAQRASSPSTVRYRLHLSFTLDIELERYRRSAT